MPLAAPDLDAAFEACRRETAEWAKTFYLGTLLLPQEKRRAIWPSTSGAGAPTS